MLWDMKGLFCSINPPHHLGVTPPITLSYPTFVCQPPACVGILPGHGPCFLSLAGVSFAATCAWSSPHRVA